MRRLQTSVYLTEPELKKAKVVALIEGLTMSAFCAARINDSYREAYGTASPDMILAAMDSRRVKRTDGKNRGRF